MSDNQFQTLYNRYLPPLYLAAVFLTGNEDIAQSATKQAFLQTVGNSAMTDERIFSVEAPKLLYKYCAKIEIEKYALPEAFRKFQEVFSKMILVERGIVVFSAMGYSDVALTTILDVNYLTFRKYLWDCTKILRLIKLDTAFCKIALEHLNV